jgi:RNA polymerase sigma factor (TIGR02999 family)
MAEVTRILSAIEAGDPKAAELLLPLVYEELRRLAAQKMAHESPDHTLEATALVHEAYLRLVDREQAQRWQSHGHFFAAAAEAMRRILIERARQDHSAKRGGRLDRRDVDWEQVVAPDIRKAAELLDLNGALTQLEQEEPQKAELVKLRYFAGLSLEESAEVMGISPTTAKRYWAYARTWLFARIRRK